MTLRKLVAVVPAVTALALAVPVAGASAQTMPVAGSPGSTIPCYPYPAFCGPNGQPWLPFFPFQSSSPTSPVFGPGPVQLPAPLQLPGLPIS
jgi:hypothetical protein